MGNLLDTIIIHALLAGSIFAVACYHLDPSNSDPGLKRRRWPMVVRYLVLNLLLIWLLKL